MLPKRAELTGGPNPSARAVALPREKAAQRAACIECSPLSPLKQLSLSPDSAGRTQVGNVSPTLLARPLGHSQLLG